MKLTRRHIVLGLAIIFIGSAFGIVGLRESSLFSVPLLPKTPRILKPTQIDTLLKSELHVVRTVQGVPPSVKKGFLTVLHEPFDMANPGEKIGGGMAERGVPNERLVFAGYTNDTAVVVFDAGGSGTRHVFIVDHQQEGGVFGATLNGHSVNDPDSLRDAIRAGEFTTWQERAFVH